MDIYNREYWYNDRDINMQLMEKSDNQYTVVDFKCDDDPYSKIADICKDLKKYKDKRTAAVLPFTSKKVKYSHCPQWVGLAIIQNSENVLKAFYVGILDKYQCDINCDINLLNKILLDNGVEYTQLNYKQWIKCYDCGPLTVINLDSLAKSEQLSSKINEENIVELRLKLKTYEVENSSVKVEISKQFIREVKENDQEKSKCRDIKIIEEILKSINLSLKSNKESISIKSTLKRIGCLCGEISKDDNDLFNIRNRYGYIRRNEKNNKVIKESGIHFDKFYQLKTYLEHENICRDISSHDLDKLKTYLHDFKEKILFILKNEMYFVQEQDILNQIDSLREENLNSSKIFVNIVDSYYKQLLLFKVKEKLNALNNIDYNEREHRYVFARVFTVIGDLANDLGDENIITNDFYLIRNKIIHCHKKIQIGDSEANESINMMINNIKNHLFSCITDIEQSNVIQSEKELLKSATKSLLNYLKKRWTAPQEESKPKTTGNNEKIKYNLDFLILKATKIIRGISENRKQKSLEDRLSHLNKEYRSQLNLLSEANKTFYPLELNQANSDLICKFSEKNLPIKPISEVQSEKKKLDSQNTLNQNLIDLKIKDINKEINYLIVVEANDSMDQIKEYSISHIMFIVSQFVRDIGQLNSNSYAINFQYSSTENFPNQIKFPFNGIFLKMLLDKSADEQKSIEYLLTLSNIEKCPIIALTLCNVGVSLAKLSLYDKSLEYLKNASEKIENFINDLIQSSHINMNDYGEQNKIKNHFNLVVFGIERYEFSIKRILAKVLHLAKCKEDSFKEFQKIVEQIQFDNIKYADINWRNEIVKFYGDFANLLIDQSNYDHAIKICEQALIIDKNNAIIKIYLLESFYKCEQFDKAKDLVKDILKYSSDDGVKFEFLISFTMICLSFSNIEIGVTDAKTFLVEMEKLIQNKVGSFYNIFNEKYLLIKLKIMFVEMKSCLNDENICHFQNLEVDATNLIQKCEGNIKNDPTIVLVYLSFCWIYCDFITKNIQESRNQEHLEKAKNYFEMATTAINSLPKTLQIEINRKLIEICVYLMSAYINYTIHNSSNLDLERLDQYLNNTISLREKFNIQHLNILNNLSIQHGVVAQKYIDKYNNGGELSDLEQALLYLDKTSPNESKLCLEQLKRMAFCYDKIAHLRFDMKCMKEAFLNYENLLIYMLPVNEAIELHEKKVKCETQIKLYIDFLKSLLNFNANNEVEENYQKFIDICNRKFGLTLKIENQRLKLENMKSIPVEKLELIKKELDYFEKNMH